MLGEMLGTSQQKGRPVFRDPLLTNRTFLSPGGGRTPDDLRVTRASPVVATWRDQSYFVPFWLVRMGVFWQHADTVRLVRRAAKQLLGQTQRRAAAHPPKRQVEGKALRLRGILWSHQRSAVAVARQRAIPLPAGTAPELSPAECLAVGQRRRRPGADGAWIRTQAVHSPRLQ
jgi:hypothetical protein